MLKIVIADDEEIERRALSMKIKKYVKEIQVCAEVENGEALIKAVQQHQPDIIIVDIEMPVLTGLEAVQLIRKEKLMEHGKIIIYTAYGQFTYAQEALKAKVDDYILKPVTIKKLVETIQKCMEQLNQERETMLWTMDIKEVVEQMKPKVEADFINAIKTSDIKEEQLRLYQRILKNLGGHGFIVSFSMHIDKSEKDIYKQAHIYKATTRILQNRLKDSLGILGEREGNEVYGYIPEPEARLLGKYSSIKLVKDIIAYAEKDGNCLLRAGIGRMVKNYEDLYSSYRESSIALHERIRKDKVIHFDDIDFDGKNDNSFLKDAEKLTILIKEQKQHECNQLLNLNYFKVKDNNIEKIKDYILETAFQVVYLLGELLIKEKSKQYCLTVLVEQVEPFKDIKELREWTYSLFAKLMDDVKKDSGYNLNDLVQGAIHYIHDNYWKEISLDILAEELGANPFYLSHIFSNVTGVNYSSYLNRYRIEKAYELLDKSSYSIDEIARKVGFSSTSYFSKVFKKKTGYTISEYRQLHS